MHFATANSTLFHGYIGDDWQRGMGIGRAEGLVIESPSFIGINSLISARPRAFFVGIPRRMRKIGTPVQLICPDMLHARVSQKLCGPTNSINQVALHVFSS